jgi:4-azaleucine resistance transporter AzlC
MKDFLYGCRRALGIVAGFLPIAMSFGAIAIQSNLSKLETIGMSVWIFAGASQFAAIEAIRQHLPWLSIVLTVLIINLRHIPMSFSAQTLYHRFSRWQRWLLCHGIVDETFALEASEPPQPFNYYLGMHLICWVAWVAGTWLGCQFGLLLPERWLAFALPSLFLCLLVNSVKQNWRREVLLVLGIGVALVMLTQRWGSVGILLAIIGIALSASSLLQAKPSEPPALSR